MSNMKEHSIRDLMWPRSTLERDDDWTRNKSSSDIGSRPRSRSFDERGPSDYAVSLVWRSLTSTTSYRTTFTPIDSPRQAKNFHSHNLCDHLQEGKKAHSYGAIPTATASVDKFIISRLNDSSSYFFTWFCKKYRIRIGVRDLGGKEEMQRCPICLDACTKSIELQCGHSFCRSCLATSAANNITSCALCRREQVINPELLRARFDEQRMLNLAQRLALPPPARSRPSAFDSAPSTGVGPLKDMGAIPSAAHVAGGKDNGVSDAKGACPMTSWGHLLFGPWGDVGAMSADDIRRRWKFSGVHSSTSPGAATVGAASADQLRCSWRELQRLTRASTCARSDGTYVGTPLKVSHSQRLPEVVCTRTAESAQAPADMGISKSVPGDPDSPCAGGSTLKELSARWRALHELPRHKKASTSPVIHGPRQRPPSLSSAKAMSMKGNSFDQHAATLSPMPSLSSADGATPTLADDIGGLPIECLGKRWHENVRGASDDVGDMDVHSISSRYANARTHAAVGSLSTDELRGRWQTAHLSGGVPACASKIRKSIDRNATQFSSGLAKGLEVGPGTLSLPSEYRILRVDVPCTPTQQVKPTLVNKKAPVG